VDAHLRECLHGLLQQNYSNYAIYIVIDSKKDPAWSFVTKIIEDSQASNVSIEPLWQRIETCSLKCSALVQMASTVDPDTEVVAFIDGDVVPHQTWLRDLVAPFSKDDTGASYGIPWYFPPKLRWGSVVRKVWWMPSGLVSSLAGWVWGGTMALRMDVLKHPDLAKRWSHALSADTSVNAVVRTMGLNSVWVPSLFMPHFEETGLRFFCRQMARYLLSARLYLPFWWGVASFVIGLNLALAGSCVIAVVALSVGETNTAVIALASLSLYVISLTILLFCVERKVRAVVEPNWHSVSRMSALEMIQLALAIPIAHILYLVGVVCAHVNQTVSWRGVSYQVRSSWNIRMHSNN
jgi:cellulose synthase/poly-beta-1,6-N-acetylglucosamine synthase-like glycosyltransferase